MIQEITGYEQKRSVRIKNQHEEEGLRHSAGLITCMVESPSLFAPSFRR